jgi:glycosyltransferase AglD
MNDIEVSAVIPVFNDRTSLETAIPESLKVLEGITDSFEMIVAEDGSTDGSRELVEEWEKKDPRVRLFHSDERLGRGKALNRAFEYSKGKILCYYDVDLATDMAHLSQLIDEIRKGAAVSTGSRLLPDSRIKRTTDREIASRSYNFLVRLFLGSKLHDHQCGFKGFDNEKLMIILPNVASTHWFWDTEILVRAQKSGYKVAEFPVVWNTGDKTTVRFKDIFSMGTSILRLWWTINVKKA